MTQNDFQDKETCEENVSEGVGRGGEDEGVMDHHHGETCTRLAGLVGLRFSKRC